MITSSSYSVLFIQRSLCFIMKVNIMALFYRSESTEKQFEYLRFTIRLVTDLGTDPDLITLVWSCVVPINQTKAVFIFFIWASETSFVMAWTWITSSVSGGGDIIQKRNVMKNKINTDKQQQNNKKNTCFFFFFLYLVISCKISA